ncbi:MAG TPA: NAD(P)-dependent oxidoreductase [Dehalococcoidia bacterium]|nr:NAD(P)-dependent oxidoreductase [Dehalococcoidia bacterium]
MKAGFIGLGRMGNHMARHLAEKGHEVAVFDVVPAAADHLREIPGIMVVSSVTEAARDAEVVGTSLPGPREVEAVVYGPGGLLETMKPGTTYVDLSTNSVTVVRRLHEELAKKGIEMLDAPVSGGTTGSEAGTLSIMVGGKQEVFERLRPFLECIGSPEKIFYCGPAGAGDVVKLCNNISGIAQMMAVGEVLTLGVKAGVDLKTLCDVIGVSSGNSRWVTGGFQRNLFQDKHAPAFFPVTLSSKDTHLALDLAHDIGVDVSILEVCGRDSAMAIAKGWGDLNFEAVVKVQEERAGAPLKLPQE